MIVCEDFDESEEDMENENPISAKSLLIKQKRDLERSRRDRIKQMGAPHLIMQE